MRGVSLVVGVVLMGLTVGSEGQSSSPVSAFDRKLIAQQKQFLHDAQSEHSTAVEQAIADDFQGIGTNGDFYDKGELAESAERGMPKDTRAYDFYRNF